MGMKIRDVFALPPACKKNATKSVGTFVVSYPLVCCADESKGVVQNGMKIRGCVCCATGTLKMVHECL